MARFFRRKSEPASETAEPKVEDGPVRRFDDIKPEPERIGIAGAVPFVRLPAPDRLFAERAARLRALAPDHPLGGYLLFLARVADAQAAAQAADAHPPHPLDDLAVRLENGMPPLARGLLTDDPAFAVLLDALLAHVELPDAPEPAQLARDALRSASREERIDLALQLFEGAIPVERMAEGLFVAAALQVYLARQAQHLDAKALKPVADGVCPCCGGPPTASVIVAWTPADKARYLSCALCGTLWNHVRIRCTACGSGEDVRYLGLDEVSKDAQAETCGVCNSYLKHLHQHRDAAIDPVADDVASYGLDLKVAEEGFKRAGLNLLFVN